MKKKSYIILYDATISNRVLQEFLKHVIPDQLRALTSFPLDCQI